MDADARWVTIAYATEDDVEQIAPRVRECDRREIWALIHKEPRDALLEMLREHDKNARACFLDGKVVALFGMIDEHTDSVTERAGILWMIGTDEIYENPDLFHEHTKRWLIRYRQRYDKISNWVDSRNTTAVEWIKSVGFEVAEPVPVGPDNVPFHYFVWRRTG